MKVKYSTMLKQRNFFLLWSGQYTSSIGDYLHSIAILWLTLQLSHSGTDMAIVIMGQIGPRLLFGLLGGGVADRWNRRYVMVLADFIRGLTVLSLPIVFALGHLETWFLFTISFILGSAECFFTPTIQSLIPQIVKKEELSTANGMIDAANRSCRIIMPIVLAGLTAFMPLYTVFYIDSATFFISCITVLLIRFDNESFDVKSRPAMWKEIIHSLKEQWKTPRIMTPTMVNVFGLMAWNGAYQVGIPILASRYLHAGLSGYSYIVGIYGVGSLFGSLIFHRLPIRDRANWVMYGWVLNGLGFVVMAMTTNLYIAMIGSFITSLGGPISSLSRTSLIQAEVPNNQVGKVFSLGGTLISIGVALSIPFSGSVFDRVDPANAFVYYGAFIILSAVVGFTLLQMLTRNQVPPKKSINS